MECERFKKLLKSWYIQVQNEALAPARMVDFMENHVEDCTVCRMDPEAKKDIAKIITLVLPQEKLRQTARHAVVGNQDRPGDEGEDTEIEAADLPEGEEEIDEETDSAKDGLEEEDIDGEEEERDAD